MKPIYVVTGGTGHIGVSLIRLLIAQDKRVRLFILPGDPLLGLKDLPLEIVEGDVRDYASLKKAFEGAEVVFHLASFVSIGSYHKNLVWRINVDGVRNVIKACLTCKVGRLVYMSSIHAFEEPPVGSPILETKDFGPEHVMGTYAKTKAEATRLVLQAVKEKGLDAVIVHPTGVFGPFDYKPSHTGQLIRDFMAGRLHAYTDGTYDYVDVRDVAEGALAAANMGRKGENYILSGEQITVKEMMDMLEEITGKPAPRLWLPLWLARVTAPASELYYKILKRPPLYTPYSIFTLSSNSLTSHDKATKEWGYHPRRVKESIFDAVKWLSSPAFSR